MVSSQKFQVLGVVVDVVVGGDSVVVVSGGGIVDGPLQSTPAPMKHILSNKILQFHKLKRKGILDEQVLHFLN